ncbi:peptidase M8 [Heterostelium album PN500]|uniref:Peptidase M8 n=1 Tax=Heterostelium pallidum (strain ATCC 26659 / Pp 5 / PN500) TaxID=670386 RepID=D3BAR9_HETP5|nr:peptidase M8 [Heterostelium album PN500]EFA81656.1 peptidase M8 [Heterostelium album PN500]|eukprot:XP_020433773.1 peptidase M8 [Heterostelium album PN500]
MEIYQFSLEEEDDRFHSNECIHDKFATEMTQKIAETLNIIGPMDGVLDRSKKIVREINDRLPIRIQFDTSQIMNDSYACYHVGDKIITGAIPNSGKKHKKLPDCIAGDEEPCIYTCQEYDVITPEMLNMTESILETINNVFTNLLSVDREPKLQLGKVAYESFGGQCCAGVKIPETALDPGIPDTDFMVYVTMRPLNSKRIAAFAGACNYKVYGHGVYGRPLAAYINFNPFYYSSFVGSTSLARTDMTHTNFVRIAIHEMIHALGFSKFFFEKSFINSVGDHYSAVRNVKRKGINNQGEVYSFVQPVIDSPNVVNYLRQQTGCQDIKYADLAFNGGSHWGTSTVGDEIMVTTSSARSVNPISNLTLNLLKDTGWYDINFEYAEPLVKNRGLRCESQSGGGGIVVY